MKATTAKTTVRAIVRSMMAYGQLSREAENCVAILLIKAIKAMLINKPLFDRTRTQSGASCYPDERGASLKHKPIGGAVQRLAAQNWAFAWGTELG